MAQWPGQHALRPNSNTIIGFSDIVHVHAHFTPAEGKSIKTFNTWGEKIEEICKTVGPGSPRAAEREQLRAIARVLLKLLEALCFEETTVEPHLNPGSKIWQPPACPVKCKNKQVMNCFQGYPKARLGKCTLEGQVYVVEVMLHRFACWLSRGEPAPTARQACHACATPSCVRLPCLSWGDASSNQKEAYERPAKRVKR